MTTTTTAAVPPTPGVCTLCKGCGQAFPSKNAVFRHLKDTDGACLSHTEYEELLQHVRQRQREKVVILYGYWIGGGGGQQGSSTLLRNGEDVARLLLEVMEDASGVMSQPKTAGKTTSSFKINRSYGHSSRCCDIVAQDDGTSAMTEILVTKLPPLLGEQRNSTSQWIRRVNEALADKLRHDDDNDSNNKIVRVLGRQHMPIGRFQAEMDISHRTVEYLLPAEFVLPDTYHGMSLQERLDEFPSFSKGENPWKRNGSRCRSDDAVEINQGTPSPSNLNNPDDESRALVTLLKKNMQKLSSHHVVPLRTKTESEVVDKACLDRIQPKDVVMDERPNCADEEAARDKSPKDSNTKNARMNETRTFSNNKVRKTPNRKKGVKKTTENILERKHYHNFTPTVMAHEFLAYRKLRFRHKATLRLEDSTGSALSISSQQKQRQRPFLALSLSGDMFLNGQACRVVGLMIALARGVIDEDFVDCVFDESYPHLVPTPPAPSFALYAGEVSYINVEGKMNAVLKPGMTHRYENGWNDKATVGSVEEWQDELRKKIAGSWLESGVSEDGRLNLEKEWVDSILTPWAERARSQLEAYREWKRPFITGSASDKATNTLADAASERTSLCGPTHLLPSVKSVDASVPEMFEKVLFYLRKVDADGLWPTTTPNRQLVMVSNLAPDESVDHGAGVAIPLHSSLIAAGRQAKMKQAIRSSAYSFSEGQGGASGSFSVGVMPGEKCQQPKGNALFPELTKAAFELELLLRPDREPSSTIAINRNAQFRPHTDSGAGAGQSTSLIVGLGTYVGGELVVEGETKDIRYKAVEFDGWKERHWTMPFDGERYSLVWFTPKGCENVHGIDLVSG